MSSKGGLPPIPVYDIHRHLYLHELTQARAKERVHGMDMKWEKIKLRKELCRARKDHYGKRKTA